MTDRYSLILQAGQIARKARENGLSIDALNTAAKDIVGANLLHFSTDVNNCICVSVHPSIDIHANITEDQMRAIILVGLLSYEE